MDAIPGVNEQQLDQIIEMLGVVSPPAVDLHGLSAIYRAWGEKVPFDNAAKLIALGTNAPGNLPGIDAAGFFANFLEHGFGGTCWPSSNALYSLLVSLGFNAARLAGSMRDTGIISHGSTSVNIDGRDWLVDSSMLTAHPLPLTEQLFIGTDPVWSAEVEYVDGTHVIWWDAVPSPDYIPCRMIPGEASHDFYVQRYEASRERSPFNQRLYIRRNRRDSILVISGNRRYVKSARGVDASELSRSGLVRALIDDAGFSEHGVDMLSSCGAIDASMQPPDGTPPPPATRQRPSKRPGNNGNAI